MSQPPQRERDAAGRPQTPAPATASVAPFPGGRGGVPRVDETVVLTAEESLTEAQRLLDGGLPFHAHEVLEGAWKNAPDAERELWQGLAQLAVGLTHVLRGNRTGARTVLTRGRDRIAPYAEAPPHGIDVRGVTIWADAVLLAPHGTPPPPQLRAG